MTRTSNAGCPGTAADAHRKAGAAVSSTPFEGNDLGYWRALAAGLQREVDAMDRKHALACEVLAMMCLRINKVVEDAAAGRLNEADALTRLNNLASVITDSIRRYHEERR